MGSTQIQVIELLLLAFITRWGCSLLLLLLTHRTLIQERIVQNCCLPTEKNSCNLAYCLSSQSPLANSLTHSRLPRFSLNKYKMLYNPANCLIHHAVGTFMSQDRLHTTKSNIFAHSKTQKLLERWWIFHQTLGIHLANSMPCGYGQCKIWHWSRGDETVGQKGLTGCCNCCCW
jgi:hypothetical protein